MSDTRWAMTIDRDAIAEAAIVAEAEPALEPGQIEVRLTRFAMTANNVTYAAMGKPANLFGNDKGYWDFFSPPDGPGRLPVWGFATVTRSTVEEIPAGEVFYGYFPLASHAVLTPGRVSAAGFTDQSPHRLDMPPVYNSYQRLAALSDYAEADRDWWPVFRPLYVTGWLMADQFEDEGDYGVRQVVVASASSKTAVSFAHAMRARASKPRMIALTSPRGKAFLDTAGLYDAFVLYDDIARLPVEPTAYVDIAGDGPVAEAARAHLGEAFTFHLVVGKSHWDAGQAGRWPANGFFAPGRIQKRAQDWGREGFYARLATSWTAFLADAKTLFTIERLEGADGALHAYRTAVAGEADPRAGVVVVP